MVNVILMTFTGAVFYGGFWCGHRFSSLKELATAAIDKCRDCFK